MKTLPERSVISPVILALALLAATVFLLTMSGINLPLLSNLRVSLGFLLILGMSICAQGGIGRIAAIGQWSHPLAIIGYILGASILILAVSVFFNISLPILANQQQAFVIIAALMGVKVLNAFMHYYFLTRR